MGKKIAGEQELIHADYSSVLDGGRSALQSLVFPCM